MIYASFKKYFFLFSFSLLTSCVSTSISTHVPCFDGWTTEGSDRSMVIETPAFIISEVNRLFPEENLTEKCTHYLPAQQKYSALFLNEKAEIDVFIFKEIDGKISYIDREYVF